MHSCNYNKVKLLADLSSISAYIEKHTEADAKSAGHALCGTMFKEMKRDIDKHIEKLRVAVEGLAREGKFG